MFVVKVKLRNLEKKIKHIHLIRKLGLALLFLIIILLLEVY